MISGQVDRTLLSAYKEVNGTELELQFSNVKNKYPIIKFSEAVTLFRSYITEVRALLNQVDKLVRLLLICLCASAEAERSFNNFRQLNIWLMLTFTQGCPNNVAAYHCHKDMLMKVNINNLIK